VTDDDQSRSPLEQARDLLVLPIGFVLELPASVPRAVARGRRALHLDGPSLPGDVLDHLQVHAHRTLRALGIGTTAQECRGLLPDEIDEAVEVDGADATVKTDDTDGTPGPGPDQGDDRPSSTPDPVVTGPVIAGPGESGQVVAGATVVGGIATRVDQAPVPAPPRPRTDPSLAAASGPDPDGTDPGGPDPDGLAIPGYDSLSASQVVPRLASLNADELDLVRQYEQANRGRKTILSKIAQLQA
jgi:hypothetical protein